MYKSNIWLELGSAYTVSEHSEKNTQFKQILINGVSVLQIKEKRCFAKTVDFYFSKIRKSLKNFLNYCA